MTTNAEQLVDFARLCDDDDDDDEDAEENSEKLKSVSWIVWPDDASTSHGVNGPPQPVSSVT